ncbi:MAG: tryptophan--tRNA ligase [Patescibacteria group bacterium]|nr:tryptophan--tRNA ligase [Patescibacteria group bacterium]MDD5121363.1 tryptophan--tRNA ligase [Patescibacteria group bacterium]MDD5222308.1 tryptophan--tRNA ligase [Patescibacteria group bacterium]MDD5395718.1 tryptophan--tRNA ligase [Patescibacteria group bacterium]
MSRLFSGIQPTGVIHIGNYLGAIKNWVALQEKYDSLFCVVNYHAMTVPYDAKKMPQMTLDLAIDLMACGIDPSASRRTILFVQSDVPETTELTWILNTVTPIGDLKRMTQFKDKSEEHPEAVNMGLFDYPVLMAADILLYKATVVPVGEDQLQHLELSREIARRFNNAFGKTFDEPKPLLTKAARLMSLTDPTKKMSKSMGPESYIAITDSPEVIEKKLATAVTDEARKKRTDPGAPEKCNIYALHKFFSSKDEIDYIATNCQKASIGCLDCKKLLAKNIIKELEPIQKKRAELIKNLNQVKKILADGAIRARAIARKNIEEIKNKTGLFY